MNMTQTSSETTYQLNLEGRPANAPVLFAYLVNHAGDTIEAQPVSEKGVFKFPMDLEDAHGARLFLAPEMPDKNKRPSVDDLREFNAYEPVLRHDARGKLTMIDSVPVQLWPKWPLCFCRVRGRVEKTFCYWLKDPFCFTGPFHPYCHPHAYCFTLPVCPARVHVCRVKRLLLDPISDLDILRIRADLLEPILVEPPFPPDPIGPVAEAEHSHGAMAMAAPVVATMALRSMPAKETGQPDFLSPALRFKLQSKSPELLRRAIGEHLEELKPLIPYFDWCHLLYSCKELRVIDVDEHGRFDTFLLHDCKQGQDLYFWVEYLYNTEWVTVYKPSLCSGTHWDYACGSEVVLTTTDTRVSGCRPITGRFLEITRVGSNGWLPLIDGASGTISGLDLGDSTLDPSGVTINSGTYARPFGGQLVLNGNFGFNLPDPALATHYRVSYKPSTLSDSNEANWTLINTPLARAYNDTLNIGGGVSKLVTSSFELKDPSFPDFYRIPKENAHQQTEITHGADLQDRRWASDEFAIAVLDTEVRALPEGTYDLRIQLCRAPSVGAAPVPVTVARELFQMPSASDFNESTFCDDEFLIQNPPGGPNASAFRMRLKVDRDHCVSSIADASVDGNVSDPQCGILPRGTNATLGFEASHPHDRATFSFGVVRGNANDVGAATAGLVSTPSAFHGYTRTGDDFSANVPVGQLFGSTGCASAAFAETLKVRAMATDGNQRLSGYDAPERSAAFAIIST